MNKEQLDENFITGETMPLYELYEKVKSLDLQTGHRTVDLQSFFTLIETNGYMLFTKENLMFLCEKLWFKPYHRESNFLNREKLEALIDEALAIYNMKRAERPEFSPVFNQPTQSASSLENKKKKQMQPVQEEEQQASVEDRQINQQQGEFSISIKKTKEDPRNFMQEQKDNHAKFLAQNFLLEGKYLPVNKRRLHQSIRLYRFPMKESGTINIDLEATIQRIAANRFFDRFEYKRNDEFITNWTFLIDQSESMAAFQAFSEEIVTIGTQGKIQNKGQVYYFKNAPRTHVFSGPNFSGPLSIQQFLAGKKMNILIVSDAGAARGNYNEDRIVSTMRFLKLAQKHKIAWLNPMPKQRWNNNSAEMIAQFINMFETGEGNNDGISNIVRLFKSKIRMTNKLSS